MTKTICNQHLLIIDPQNDFCDLPPEWCSPGAGNGFSSSNDSSATTAGALEQRVPSLPVAGAHAGLLRLAGLIGRLAPSAFNAITITLDTHHRLHIAHPGFWQRIGADETGALPVAPFTEITAESVRAQIFAPRNPALLPAVLGYLDALQSRGRYRLMVWPVHCELGSWGHAVHPAVRSAYNTWEEHSQRTVQKVCKGSNLMTEHYSALQAEVPDASDPATGLNTGLLASLASADWIVVAGEASSHCVRATVEDLVEYITPSKIVLLADCMHPVAGFEAQHHAFLEGMTRRGMVISSSTEFVC